MGNLDRLGGRVVGGGRVSAVSVVPASSGGVKSRLTAGGVGIGLPRGASSVLRVALSYGGAGQVGHELRAVSRRGEVQSIQ